MFRKIALCLLVAAPLAAPAVAAPGDQAQEVRSLESATRLMPRDGGNYIELAQAYVRANRPADARDAYRRALALDNVMLETRTGDSVWSHEIAKSALGNEVRLTSR
jgi:cytochrome c-type biogenesis protein CcmH/NrfG